MKLRNVFSVLCLLLTSDIMACTCGGKSLEADYKRAIAVVEGRIVGRKIKTYQVTLPGGESNSYTYFEYKVRVKQVYKGQPGKYLYVATAREGATCGMPFKVGGWYLVSAFFDERYGQSTSRCDTNLNRKEFIYKQEIQALKELSKKS